MEKNYNYRRVKLVLPEYGRHIHQMIDDLKSIHDRDLRNSQARVVVGVMGNVNPALRDSADFVHKLWDHLFIMAGFDLDVDSPYPIPSGDSLHMAEATLRYPDKRISHKHYGKNIVGMVRNVAAGTPGEGVGVVVENIARYLRAKSYEFNQEHLSDEILTKEIRNMSDNVIILDENSLNNIKKGYKNHLLSYQKKGKIPAKIAKQTGTAKQGRQNHKHMPAKKQQ